MSHLLHQFKCASLNFPLRLAKTWGRYALASLQICRKYFWITASPHKVVSAPIHLSMSFDASPKFYLRTKLLQKTERVLIWDVDCEFKTQRIYESRLLGVQLKNFLIIFHLLS
jgi:hypothetical protein